MAHTAGRGKENELDRKRREGRGNASQGRRKQSQRKATYNEEVWRRGQGAQETETRARRKRRLRKQAG